MEGAGSQWWARTFFDSASIYGAGNSTQLQQYQWVDATPGALGYYRLRQVDYDGRQTLSPVVVVKAQLVAALVAVYPNPAVETLTITGAVGPLSVFDQLWRQVQHISFTPMPAPQADIRRLPAGVYYLRDASTGTGTRFVKATSADAP